MRFLFRHQAIEAVDSAARPSRAARSRVAAPDARLAVGRLDRRGVGLDVAVVGVCLLVIGALWFSVVTRDRIERERTLDAAIVRNDNMAATFEQYAVRTLDNADAVLQATKREYVRSGAQTDLAGVLKDLGIAGDAYKGLGIIDERGDLVMTTMRVATTVNFSDREHFTVHARQDTGKVYVGKPVLSRILGVMTIPLTRRINKADGSFGGVVVAQIEPARFIDFSRDATQGADDVLSIVGLEGMTRARRVGDRWSSGQDLSANPSIVQWRESAVGHYTAPGMLDGIRRLYSYRRLHDYPLVVTVGQPEGVVLAEVDARQARIEAIAAALTVLIGGLAVLLVVALHRKQRLLQALAGSEARLSAVFHQASVGFATLTRDGRFLQVNQKFCDIVGYSAVELPEKTVAGITHPDDLATTELYIAGVLGRAAMTSAPAIEKRYVRKDGSSVWVDATAAVLAERPGDPRNLVAIVQDITARKEADDGRLRVARGRRLMAECSRVLVHATEEARLLKSMCEVLVGPGGYAHAWVGAAMHDEAKSIRTLAQAGAHADYVEAAKLSWSEGGRHQGTSGRAIRLGELQMVADIGADPSLAPWHELARRSGFCSVASLPLFGGSTTFGVLTIHARERDAFDPGELALLQELAADLAYGIESLRTRTAYEASVAKLRDSEERTRRYFELGPMGMAVVSSAGEWIDVNEQLCSMLEYDRADLLQTTWTSVICPGDRLADAAEIGQVRAGKSNGYTRTLRMMRSTGREMIASVAVRCVRRTDGSVRYLLAQIEDITERMLQEAALAQASERLAQQSRLFDTSLSALSDFAYTLDEQGRFLYANAPLLKLWGMKLADVIGKDFFDLNYPDDQATLLQRQLREVVDTKHNVVGEMRYVDPSGAVNDYEYIFNPVFAPDGSVETIAGVSRDITQRKRVEDALRAKEQQQRQLAVELDVERERLVEAQTVAKVGSWETDLATMAVIWSREVHRIFETDSTAFAPTHARFLSFVHPDDRAQVDAAFVASASQTAACVIEHRLVMPDGRVKTVEQRWQIFHDSHGKALRALGTCQDITERTVAQDQVRLQADLLAAVGQSVIAADLDGRIFYANRHAEELYGWTASDMLGRSVLDVTRAEPSATWCPETVADIVAGARWAGEVTALRRDGTPVPIQLAITPIHDKSGALIGTVGVAADITERKAHEHRIEYLATHDALTDLPNRTLLSDRLTQAVAHAQRNGASVGVIFLDLDHFKFVNDGYGHPLGDALLEAIAERLRATVRSTDTIARLGGDEFVVLATELVDPMLGASAVAQSVVDAFARPFTVEGRELSVTVSMGISLYPADGDNLDELLKNADAAMYRAKDNGRNGYQFYATEMSQKAVARVTMEVALRQALQLDQFELHYQPLLEMRTGELTGVEALIRWRHPELGMIPPTDFIPLAEETGLIVPIGDWVLRTACAQNKAWQQAGMPPLTVGVNLSALQLRQPGFVAGVERVLAESGLAGRYLNLELTESMVMGTTPAVVASLEQLRSLGVSLSMDDFGTGYSNLGHLTHLPLDVLKIDRSFINGVPGHHGAESIARAIVSMGHSLGMRVVAEGVESVEQAEFLQSIWCEHAQGYLYCKPLPASACAAWMRERIVRAATRASRNPVVEHAA